MRAVVLAIACTAACGRVDFDPAATDAPIAAGDGAPAFCAELPALAAEPTTYDGFLEPGLVTRPLDAPRWDGPGAPPAAISARFAVAHTATGVYFYLEVTDPDRNAALLDHPFCGDAIEMFVDSDGAFSHGAMFDAPGAAQLMIEAPASSSDMSSYGEIWRDEAEVGEWTARDRYRTFPTSYGYSAEAYVLAADLGLATWDLAAGAHLAIDLAVDVSTPDGSPGTPEAQCTTGGGAGMRLGQLYWHADVADPEGTCAGRPFCDARAMCPALAQ